jgi:Concanavalin A-like lectin/glucanases superfamily
MVAFARPRSTRSNARTSSRGVCRLLSAASALLAACQPASTVSHRDAAAELPAFDVSPLDGATAGYALSFNGAQYATAGDAGFAPVGNSETYEMWVKYTDPVDTQDFLVLRMDLTDGIQVGIHAGALAVWRVYVDRVLVQAPTLPSANTWHHVAYSYDTSVHRLYVDGAIVDTESNPTDGHTPTSVWLGTLDGYTNLLKGTLDEVRVWTVVRSAGEILTDMRHSSGQGETGLVAYWTFDDAPEVGRSLDLSGSGNDVTFGDGIVGWMPSRVPSDIPF